MSNVVAFKNKDDPASLTIYLHRRMDEEKFPMQFIHEVRYLINNGTINNLTELKKYVG